MFTISMGFRNRHDTIRYNYVFICYCQQNKKKEKKIKIKRRFALMKLIYISCMSKVKLTMKKQAHQKLVHYTVKHIFC